jgi:hypothetical protein
MPGLADVNSVGRLQTCNGASQVQDPTSFAKPANTRVMLLRYCGSSILDLLDCARSIDHVGYVFQYPPWLLSITRSCTLHVRRSHYLLCLITLASMRLLMGCASNDAFDSDCDLHITGRAAPAHRRMTPTVQVAHQNAVLLPCLTQPKFAEAIHPRQSQPKIPLKCTSMGKRANLLCRLYVKALSQRIYHRSASPAWCLASRYHCYDHAFNVGNSPVCQCPDNASVIRSVCLQYWHVRRSSTGPDGRYLRFVH